MVMKTMSSMSKILKQPYILAGLAMLFVAFPVFAAVDDLIVEFENTPLFDEANFLPGDDITRSVGVTNNTEVAKDIVVEAINTSDPDGLGDVLIIEITEGITILYTDTIAAFFAAGEIALSELAGLGTETEYDFTIGFEDGSENAYQGKSVGFDILIGFLGEGGGGGGGGGGLPPGLVIKDESVTVTDIEEFSVTIEWLTSHFSTSQVIYGTAVEDHTLDLSDNIGSPPTYGYAHTTAEFDTSPKVTFHSVSVTGLTPGTTYFFRTVSHASPPTITREYTFATLILGDIENNEAQTSGPGALPEQEIPQGGLVQGVADDRGAVIEVEQDEEEMPPTGDSKVLTAGIGFVLDSLGTPFLIILILILLVFFLIFFKKRKEKQNR